MEKEELLACLKARNYAWALRARAELWKNIDPEMPDIVIMSGLKWWDVFVQVDPAIRGGASCMLALDAIMNRRAGQGPRNATQDENDASGETNPKD